MCRQQRTNYKLLNTLDMRYLRNKLERIKAFFILRINERCSFQKYNTDLDTKKIYAYYSAQYGGVYKTMEFQSQENGYEYGFVRIDNRIGYCQFRYKTLKELFKHHFDSLHSEYQLYVFDNTTDFFKWCLLNEKLA